MELLPILEPNRPADPAPVAAPEADAKATYAFVSLGCPKNLVDSEKMLGNLALEGFAPVSNPDGADFVIVNTCGFIESSRAESKAVIQEMLDLKAAGKTKGVIVAGCLPERVGPALLEEMPEVDHVVGVFGRDEIADVASKFVVASKSQAELLTEQRELFRPAPIQALDDRQRLRITPRHYAYLKISEGCDRTCTFCSIPMMRGKHVTKPIETVVAEAQELAADGVEELILVAQDTTYYGLDLYGEVRLTALLRELEQVAGLKWIRLMYLYPVHFSDELIDVIAGSERILPYLDMPLQHVNDRVLKRMQRRVREKEIRDLVGKLRDRVPNLVLRTTFITGFPGETDEQFEELKRFVEETKFERMGAFTFSPEPGTPAMKLDGHLPDEVKEARRDALMETQQRIAFDFADSLVGYELDAVVDAELGDGYWSARTFADAPEIDASVVVTTEDAPDAVIEVGQFLPVEIVGRNAYDLVGVPATDEE